MRSEAGTQIAKAAPAVAGTFFTWSNMDKVLGVIVGILTIIYIVYQIYYIRLKIKDHKNNK